MITKAVGEIITVPDGNEVIVTASTLDNGCLGCYFRNNKTKYGCNKNSNRIYGVCSSKFRTDGKSVIFRKV